MLINRTLAFHTMPTASVSPLPPRIAGSLVKLGRDIDVARKTRRLTISALCERAGSEVPRVTGQSVDAQLGRCAQRNRFWFWVLL